MANSSESIDQLVRKEYSAGWTTDIEQETFAPGLNEQVVRRLSEIKQEPEWLLEFRLRAYRHWLTMSPPDWAKVHYPPIDYQAITYYAAPKRNTDGPKSLAEVDPELLRTY